MTTDLQQERGFDDFMRDSKIPLTLIGIGAAWLLVGNTGLADRVVKDERVQAVRRRIGELAGNMRSEDRTGDPRGGSILGPDGKPFSHSGRDHDSNWVHQAAGAATNAITSVRGAASAIVERAGNTSKFAGQASDQDTERLATDPWLIGVAGLVAGVVVAAIVPFTQVEQDYIGEARDDLLNRAQQLGHSAAERVHELAENRT